MQHFALKGEAHASVASASCVECAFLEVRLQWIPVLDMHENFVLFCGNGSEFHLFAICCRVLRWRK